MNYYENVSIAQTHKKKLYTNFRSCNPKIRNFIK